MAKELFVSSTPHETKVAIVEDDQLAEIYYERENEYTLAGSIYKGRVTRVLPGMQSAFVNIGLERDAFLYVSDFLLEEDEDADAIGEAVARSRTETAVIEVPSAEGSQEPIEAEQIIPPSEADDDVAEEEQVEATAAESNGRQEPEREGARRWRGRRRRGRGGRDRFADRTSGDRSSDRPEREHAEEAAKEDHGEPQQESHEEQHSEHAEPQAEHARKEHPRSEHHRQEYHRPEPILLPGESISKYQPHGSQPTATTPVAAKIESGPRPRPSTEYSIDSAAFSADSMILPGESLAKYGKQSQAARVETETIEHEAAPEHEEHGFLQDRESAGPIPRNFEEEDAEARVEAPSVLNRVELAQEPQTHREAPEHVEFTDRSDDETERSYRDERSYEDVSVANVFGAGVAEEVEELQQERSLEQLEESPSTGSAEAEAEEPATREQRPWQSSGHGVVEEEEIEEEESEMPGFEEDPDMVEYEELEEEVLGKAGEHMVPMGNELMEAVRDAHVDEQATGKYEAEGLDPEELEQVEEAFGLAEEAGDEAENGEETEEETEDLEGASAEQRAPAAAGYQQRTERKPDRRGGRRGQGGRRMRDQRPAQGRSGDPGADRQGADRQERCAHYQPHCVAGPLPGLHAYRASHRRFAQDWLRRGKASSEAHCAERAWRCPGRLHCPHSRRGS
jgi:ribonuclease G